MERKDITYKYIKDKLFQYKAWIKTTGRDLRLAEGKFNTNLKKYSFTKWVVDAWKRLRAEVVNNLTVTELTEQQKIIIWTKLQTLKCKIKLIQFFC